MPLERFELEQLHRVADVLGARQPYAMVQDPADRVHRRLIRFFFLPFFFAGAGVDFAS
jgi:hypothetical protein